MKYSPILGTTAICILLRRLVYPCRLSDLSEFFGLSPQSLSSIINKTVNIIMNRHGNLLDNLDNVQYIYICILVIALIKTSLSIVNIIFLIPGST